MKAERTFSQSRVAEKVVDLVNDHGPITMMKLIPLLYNTLLAYPNAQGWLDILGDVRVDDLLYEMVENRELVGVSYVLPPHGNRERVVLFPCGTTIVPPGVPVRPEDRMGR